MGSHATTRCSWESMPPRKAPSSRGAARCRTGSTHSGPPQGGALGEHRDAGNPRPGPRASPPTYSPAWSKTRGSVCRRTTRPRGETNVFGRKRSRRSRERSSHSGERVELTTQGLPMSSALLMSFEPIRFELIGEFGAELPAQHPAEREGLSHPVGSPPTASNQIWYMKTRFSFGCRKTLLPSFRPSSPKR